MQNPDEMLELVDDDELFEEDGETVEVTTPAPRMAFLILNVGMQPAVFDVVKALKEDGLQLDWSDPESYHVTLVGFYCGDEEPALAYPPFGQGYGLTASQLGYFNSEDGYSLHLAIDPDMMLKDYQAMLAALVRWNGYELSAYSEPDMWTPHITLGYSEAPLEALPILQAPVMIPTGSVALSVQAPVKDDDFEIVEVKQSLFDRFVSAVNALFGRKSSLFDSDTGFKVLSDNRFIAWYTNAYQDRDGEWFSEKSIEADIARMNKTQEFPELWFWHIPGTRMGKAKAALKVGRFAVATGTFDETPYAQAMKRYLKKHGRKYTLSHGFTFPRSALVGGVYHQHATFEISPLLATKASNPYTFFYAVEEGSKMSNQLDPVAIENMREALKGSNIRVEDILAAGLGATKQADDDTGHNFKGEKVNEELAAEIKGLRSDFQELVTLMKAQAEKAAMPPKGDPEDDETEGEAEQEMKPKRKEAVKSAVELELEAMRAEIKALRDENASKAQSVQGANIQAAFADYFTQGGTQNQKAVEEMPFGIGAMKAMKAMGVEE